MFLKYLEPIFKPWRMMRSSIEQVRTVKGNIVAEKNRVARFGGMAQSKMGMAQGHMKNAQAQVKQAQGQAQQLQGHAAQMQGHMPGKGPMQGQMPPGQMPPGYMPNMQAPGPVPGQMPMAPKPTGQMPGLPPMPGGINPNPPIKKVGFFRRRKVCTQCNTELDKTWDSCPYCAQAAAAQQPVAAKTQAFRVDASGASAGQLLGWIVPIDGPQRGELYTLSPHSVIGTDPTCQVVLMDQYMSSRHAEIKAEGGTWILRDLGSTNGTYVNDRRVDQHELVDNDFVKFGQSIAKFKCL